MTSYTHPDRLPAPDDYQQAADAPAAYQSLANATQAALLAHDAANVVNAGNGLVGGGAIGTSPVLHVNAGAGITVGPDDVRIDLSFTDGRYSGAGHTHPGVYSPVDHAHPGVYSTVDHMHPGVYSTVDHGHDYSGIYAPIAHSHPGGGSGGVTEMVYQYSEKPPGTLTLNSGSYTAMDSQCAWTAPIGGFMMIDLYLNVVFTFKSGDKGGVRVKFVREAWNGEPIDPTAYQDFTVTNDGWDLNSFLVTHGHFLKADPGRRYHWEIGISSNLNAHVDTRYAKYALMPVTAFGGQPNRSASPNGSDGGDSIDDTDLFEPWIKDSGPFEEGEQS